MQIIYYINLDNKSKFYLVVNNVFRKELGIYKKNRKMYVGINTNASFNDYY
ncbi:hypothetical protein JCM1393_06730 [Clostridium carnis]